MPSCIRPVIHLPDLSRQKQGATSKSCRRRCSLGTSQSCSCLATHTLHSPSNHTVGTSLPYTFRIYFGPAVHEFLYPISEPADAICLPHPWGRASQKFTACYKKHFLLLDIEVLECVQRRATKMVEGTRGHDI